MTTETELETKPMLGDAPPCWPPVAHLVRKEDQPVKEGTIALCGTKLMGIDLGSFDSGKGVCKRCLEIRNREQGL